MKQCSLIYFFFVAALVAPSCRKEVLPEDPFAGKPVVFRAEIDPGQTETKVYANNNDNRSAPVTYQWSGSGDKVLLNVLNDGSQNPRVNSTYERSSGAWTSASPITWGTTGTPHTFYGVYPAGSTNISLNENVVEARVQTPIVPGDFTRLFMTAAKYVPEATGEVTIPFRPFVTPIRVVFTNNKSYRVRLDWQNFSVSGYSLDDGNNLIDLPVAGKYRATIQPYGTCIFADGDLPYDNAANGVTVNDARTIGVGASSGFTFFILPQKYEVLRFTMYLYNYDGGSEFFSGDIDFKASDFGSNYFEPFCTHVFHIALND